VEGTVIHVLLIEDSAVDLALIRGYLCEAEEVRIDLQHVERLSSALNRLASSLIDLVLLDLGLPDSFGLETLRSLRAHAPQVPVVVLTGTEAIETALEAIRERATDYLFKSELDRPLLIRAIRYAVERKNAEKGLADSEERFRTLAEQSPNMIFINKGGRVVYANAKCEELMGYTRDEFYAPNFDFRCLIAPEYRQVVEAAYGRHTRGEEVEPIEYALIAKDGRRIDAILATKLMDYEGETAILGIITDITEHKRLDQALLQSEQRFRAIVDNAPDGILLAELESRRLTAGNEMICKMLGYTREEIENLAVPDIHPEQDLPYVLEQFEKQARGELTLAKDIPVKRKDGTVFYADVNAFLITLVEKPYLAGIFRDITDRRRSQEAMRQSEARYRLIADNVSDMVWVGEIEGLAKLVDADARAVVETGADELLDGWQFTFISPSIERVLGYEVHEAMRLTAKDLLTAASYTTLQQVLSEELTVERSGEGDPSRERTVELEHVTKDGKHRWCEVGMKFLRDDNDQIMGVVGSTRDISPRKDLEREIAAAAMHEQQRIGQELHDGLGQQLLGLGLMARSLQKTLEGKGAPEAESAGELVQLATDARDHLRALMKGVRPVEVEAGGLMAALADLAGATQQLAGVCCTFECREPVRVADNYTAMHLFHVAQEAVRNAVKHARAKSITIGLATDERRLRLWVRDDGRGLPAESGRTDGMGLRIMRYRATLIGCTLAVRPAQGGGTLVTCTVPLE